MTSTTLKILNIVCVSLSVHSRGWLVGSHVLSVCVGGVRVMGDGFWFFDSMLEKTAEKDTRFSFRSRLFDVYNPFIEGMLLVIVGV
jgi:hypothetical protein